MSYTLGNLIVCQTAQAGLDQVFNTQEPSSLRESLPGLQWVLSPENRRGTKIQQLLAPGGGKKRSVRVLYNQELSEDEVTDNCATVCESENDFTDAYQDYELPDACSEINKRFSLASLAEICEDDSSYIYRKLDDMIWALDQKIATKTMEQLPEFVGAFASDELNVTNNVKTVYYQKANGDATDRAIASINFATRNAGYPTSPVIMGFGEEVDLYFQRMAAGCCYQGGWNFGDIMRNNSKVFIADRRLGTVLTANHLLTLAAGAVQFVNYNAFEGKFRTKDSDTIKQMTVRSRYTGLNHDLIIHNPDCGDTVSIQVKNQHALVGLPTDRYAANHRLAGVTGVNEFALAEEA